MARRDGARFLSMPWEAREQPMACRFSGPALRFAGEAQRMAANFCGGAGAGEAVEARRIAANIAKLPELLKRRT
jgi:hypothetical protein